MDIQDILFDTDLSASFREGIFGIITAQNLSPYTKVLKPTASNNDINGSQHHNHEIDFTYEDVETIDLHEGISTVGIYDYFSSEGSTHYTGHYYHGSEWKFQALVIDPPAYAAEHTIGSNVL